MQIITPSAGTIVEGDTTLKALKVAPRWGPSRGHYFWSGRTGLLTTIAADADILAVRWIDSRFLMVLDLLKVRATVTTPPTAAQEWGFYARMTQNWSVDNSAGNTAVPQGGFTARKRGSYPAPLLPIIRYPVATGALTSGTYNQGADFLSETAWELAAGAAVARSRIQMERDYGGGVESPPIFSINEGFVLRNSILMGAAFVIRMEIELAWHEVDPDCL